MAFTNVYKKGWNNNKTMTREEFIEKAKELAIDFWTMNLRDGTYESKFTELLDEYDSRVIELYGLIGRQAQIIDALKEQNEKMQSIVNDSEEVGDYVPTYKPLDIHQIVGDSAFKAGVYLRSFGWEEVACPTDYKRWFIDFYARRSIILKTAPHGALGEKVESAQLYDGVFDNAMLIEKAE